MTYPDPNAIARRYSYVEQYRERPFAQSAQVQQQQHSQQQHTITVKVEDVDSPNLLPVPNLSQAHYSTQHHHHHPPTNPSYYRFSGSSGSSSLSSSSPTTPVTPFTFMSGPSWPPSSSHSAALSASSYQQHYSSGRLPGYMLHNSLDGHPQHVLPPLQDDYDDVDDDGLGDLPSTVSLNGYGGSGLDAGGSGLTKAGEKQIRRRSSKACDQCRKSKCKCERGSPQEPCKNCVLLGTACTFLGPSRKRGPPKGYIDAIEARLHQTEALIGIMLASRDNRAKSLLEDLSQDNLAKDIIDRVNNSPYGYKGRKRGAAGAAKPRPSSSETRDGQSPVQSAHPSNEWQDAVTIQLNARASQRKTLIESGESFGETDPTKEEQGTLGYPATDDEGSHERGTRSSLSVNPPHDEGDGITTGAAIVTPLSAHADRPDSDSQPRRQKRRMETDNANGVSSANSPSATSLSGRSQSPSHYQGPPLHPALLNKRSSHSLRAKSHSRSPEIGDGDGDYESGNEGADGEGEDELAIAVGQLSINEDEQVRYHGKASGLHLLGATERDDGRSEGGIWRFPKARVWPPLPETARTPTKSEDDWTSCLPPLDIQEHLLDVYFTYVHAQLPIVHKRTFMEMFRNGNVAGGRSPMSEGSSPAGSQASYARSQRIPAILLLAMFSIAARYSTTAAPPPERGSMWPAGDGYMEDAKVILDSSYSQSRPSTCQALLLLGYREVGIGAMAQAWLYIGMAVRMAQDLGLHKTADKWSNVGKNLFSEPELQERRRIWYGCVIMDKYISAYIGRPVAIAEHDFDTELPSTDESDELEPWMTHGSPVYLDDASEERPPSPIIPVVGYVISCFNESAKLSIILSMIMQTIYPIRPHYSRQNEFTRLEELLTKWHLELPEHLRFDPTSAKYASQPPHILTLHMQYWCTVLLLHRPFIRHLAGAGSKGLSPTSRDAELRANSRKNYDRCVQAANQITAVISNYVEHHCPRRAAVFLTYYVFTAAIQHVSTLSTYPGDPTASSGFRKCVDILERMQRVWPSAWRQNQLLIGSKVSSHSVPEGPKPLMSDRVKRVAESLEENITEESRMQNSHGYRNSAPYADADHAGPSQAGYPLQLDIPSSDPPAFYQSYTRWTSESTLPNMAGNLSTSVLPQQYSTGLVDDRMHRNQDRQNRFPQYWSDYSALGQIDPTYGIPVMGELVSPHTAGPQSDQQMYVQDQFGLYNNLPPNNQ